MNNAFGRLQDYAARVAGYMGVIATGGIAVRPTAITPRCYQKTNDAADLDKFDAWDRITVC